MDLNTNQAVKLPTNPFSFLIFLVHGGQTFYYRKYRPQFVFFKILALLITFLSPGSAQAQPDLIVTDIKPSSTTLTLHQLFNVEFTASNIGDVDLEDFIDDWFVDFYASQDPAINIGDTYIGGIFGVGLESGASLEASWVVMTPPEPGQWWVGACISDASSGKEINTANNCSSGVEVTVTGPPRPDMQASFSYTENLYVAADEPFILSGLDIQNVGGATSPATTVRYFISTDQSITPSDTEIGTSTVPNLGPRSRDNTYSQVLAAPPLTGDFWIGFCIDQVAEETDTSNNCSTGVPINIRTIQSDIYEPDDASENAKVVSSDVVQSRSLFPLGDTDWIRFTLDKTQQLSITATAAHILRSIRVTLFNSELFEIETSLANFTSPTANLVSPLLPPGDYYLKIDAPVGNVRVDEYTLRIDFPNGSGLPGSITPVLNLLLFGE